MTKKSYARQMRDKCKEELKDNRCWDELNQIYESTRVMLYQHTMIQTLASNDALLAMLQNPNDTASSIKILARDLKDMNSTLSHIYSKHQGKTGGSQDPDEVMSSIMISQEYAQMMEQHTSVVQPTAIKILEDFQYAEEKLQQAMRQQQMMSQHNGDVVDGELTQ